MGNCNCSESGATTEDGSVEVYDKFTSPPKVTRTEQANDLHRSDSVAVSLNLCEVPEIPDHLTSQAKTALASLEDCVPLSFSTPVKQLLLEDASFFKGECLRDSVSGKGERFFPDHRYLRGSWNNGQIEGEALEVLKNGDYYIGEFLNGKRHGRGTFVSLSEESTFEGTWENGHKVGEGKEYWKDGTYFEGSFSNGVKHGSGKLVWAEGETYQGSFVQDEMQGQGKYEWTDGRTYTGDWKHNMMNGQGLFTWPDGKCYQGHYINDKKHGFGVFTWKSGKRYEGNWQDGVQHGMGKVYYLDGTVRQGEWHNGERVQWVEA